MINVNGKSVDIGNVSETNLIEEGACALLAVCDLLYREHKDAEYVKTVFMVMVGMGADSFNSIHGFDLCPDD